MASPALRLRGQEVSIRIVQDGEVTSVINSIGSFNDSADLEIQEDGFLGEPVNRFDDILNGFGGDFEIQLTTANWLLFQRAILERARRDVPGRIFNIVRTDIYASGESCVWVYKDVKWGAQPTSIPSRKDFVKVKAAFKNSERAEQINAIV